MNKYILIVLLITSVSFAQSSKELKEKYIAYYQFCDINGIKYCISNGVDINIQDNFGNTALIYSSEAGKTKIVKYLLDNGANPNILNHYGTSPLFLAEYGGEEEMGFLVIIKLLKLKGATYNKLNYKFIRACANNNLDNAKKYLTQGANINSQLPDGYSALMLASENGYLNIVKFLIKNKADMQINTNYNNSALYLAIDRNRENVALYLIKSGAKVNMNRTDGGGSILSCAKRKGNKKILNLLIKNGAKEYQQTIK